MVTKRQASLAFFALLAINALGACSDAPVRDLTAPLPPGLASTSAQSASTFTTNEVIPFGFAFEGCEETVVVSGRLHILMHGTISSSGNIHSKVHFQPQNIRGFGLTSGAEYVFPGVLQETVNLNGPAPVTHTFVNNFELIGRGRVPNLVFHLNTHLTINANGDMTAAFAHVTTDCK